MKIKIKSKKKSLQEIEALKKIGNRIRSFFGKKKPTDPMAGSSKIGSRLNYINLSPENIKEKIFNALGYNLLKDAVLKKEIDNTFSSLLSKIEKAPLNISSTEIRYHADFLKDKIPMDHQDRDNKISAAMDILKNYWEDKSVLAQYNVNTSGNKTPTQDSPVSQPAQTQAGQANPPPTPAVIQAEPPVKYSKSGRSGIYPYYNVISKTQGFPQEVSQKEFDAVISALGGSEKLAEAERKKGSAKGNKKPAKGIKKPAVKQDKPAVAVSDPTVATPQPISPPKELSYQDIATSSNLPIEKVTKLLDFMQDNNLLKDINIELSTSEKEKTQSMVHGNIDEALLSENQIKRFKKLALIK